MIAVSPPCDFCHTPTVPHCQGDERTHVCAWSRCPRCNSYGTPGENFVQWHAQDYINPYSLLDLEVAEPNRTLPAWLEETYGTHRPCDTPDA